MMKSYVPTMGMIVVVGLTVASGLIFGMMSNRWGPPEELVTIGAQLQEVPETFGDWRLLSSSELSEAEREVLECTGQIVRTYVNRQTGSQVNAVLLVGPSMPISLHRAEICWNTQGHSIREPRKQVTLRDIEDNEQQFWAVTFETNDANRDRIRVYYGWSEGARWSEEAEHRLSVARRPYLYKMEVACQLPPGTEESNGNDPCRQFLAEFIPAMSGCLVGPEQE